VLSDFILLSIFTGLPAVFLVAWLVIEPEDT
jgi:hypothetical protein